MDALTPEIPPTPYKNRRGWLIAFGIFEILMGCFSLLLFGFFIFAFYGAVASGGSFSNGPGGSSMRPVMLALAFVQYGVMAAIFFVGGIGSIRCKNWARVLMLVVSGLWLGFGVMTTGFMAFVLPVTFRQMPTPVAPVILHGMMIVMFIVMIGLGIVLPSILLLFYSRKNVKATCLARKAAQAESGLHPVPQAGTSLSPRQFWARGRRSARFRGFARSSSELTVLFGVALHGTAAALVMLIYAAFGAAAAWYIFHKQFIGWTLALVKTVIWTASTIVSCFHLSSVEQAMREFGFDAKTMRIFDQFPHFLLMSYVEAIAAMTATLVFIFYVRKFFPAEAQA